MMPHHAPTPNDVEQLIGKESTVPPAKTGADAEQAPVAANEDMAPVSGPEGDTWAGNKVSTSLDESEAV